jgi:hypothetical protein
MDKACLNQIVSQHVKAWTGCADGNGYIVKENDGALKAVKKLYVRCAQHLTQHYIIGAALSRSYELGAVFSPHNTR